ncbi:MAG TPA: HEAT repeat domain-containing protein [Blastocatellia bacterium]
MIVRTFFMIALGTLACAQANHVGSVKVARAAAAAPISICRRPFEAVPGPGPIQRPGFVAVEGANLSARMNAAIALGRAAGARYWTAYAFDVRPGVSVDVDWNGARNSGDVDRSGNISFDSTRETRNLGVFLLREPNDTEVTRVEVYNLDRAREYSGYRVYWLGRAGNEESLSLLRGLVEGHNDKTAAKVSEHATMAVALHDDARVAGILKNFVRQSSVEKARTSAVFWLGQIGGETQFLADLARNESEGREVRKQAAFAIGISKDSDAISTLRNLYNSVADRDVKEQIIFAASINQDKDASVNS